MRRRKKKRDKKSRKSKEERGREEIGRVEIGREERGRLEIGRAEREVVGAVEIKKETEIGLESRNEIHRLYKYFQVSLDEE